VTLKVAEIIVMKALNDFLKTFWWHTTTGSTTGWSPFLFSNHHMAFTIKSRFVSHVFCRNPSQLKIKWTRWTLSGFETTFPFIPSD